MTTATSIPFARRYVYLAVIGACFSGGGEAACITIGTTTTCDASSTQTTTVGSGPVAPAGSSVSVDVNAQISTSDANAISLGTNANISIGSGSIVQTNATVGGGLYGTGNNTIEFDSNSTLTIAAGAKVLATGTYANGEAINVQGTGTSVVNNGEIRAKHAAAIWFQDAAALNFVTNNATGVIATDQAGYSVIGSEGDSALDFTNKGAVIGNLSFGNADDRLRLYTGSSIVGTINGGGGHNLLTLNGSGFAVLANTISGIQTFTKQDSGTWVLNGNITGLTTANINQGTLAVGDAANASHSISGTFNVASGATLGGYGQIDGTVNNNGSVSVANAISDFSSNANGNFTINGTLNNAGLIQVGGKGVGNTLTVSGGGYVGQNGTIALNTVLGGDGAASDKLILNGVAASGNTILKITNVGGAGASTTGNGILVVDAINGGITTATAFSLASPVSIGAYSYRLFKGDAATGASEDWYLRSSMSSVDSSGTVTQIPLFRKEVPLYAVAPAVVRAIGLLRIDDFHTRQGDQVLLTDDTEKKASWGRAWSDQITLQREGSVKPSFDGNSMGLQTGRDLYTCKTTTCGDNHFGVFLSYGHAQGSVKGNAEGIDNLSVGNISTDSYGVGAYWSHVGSGGWYTDAVITGSYLALDTRSDSSINASSHGTVLQTSLEAGLPIVLNSALSAEPQAQVIWQHLNIGDINDSISNAGFHLDNSTTVRLGLRVQGKTDGAFAMWHPYFQADMLRTFNHTDNVTFDQSTTIAASGDNTIGQFGIGFVIKFHKSGSMYTNIHHSFDLSGNKYSALGANIGMRWVW